MKKIYTCTPFSFEANEHFHIRDTGLIASTLRTLGVESKCIMPLPHHEGDLELPLIRTEMKNLRDSKWWKTLGIDAVILYSWGHPKYTLIARAIKKAGLDLMIHMDFSGDLNISAKSRGPFYWVKNFIFNILRSVHLNYADYISTSPYAAQNFKTSSLYGTRIAKKIKIMPAPVSPHFKVEEGANREKRVIVVGRWTDNDADKVKRPDFMLRVAHLLAQKDQSVNVQIYGRIGSRLQAEYDSFSTETKGRVRLMGYALNKDLPHAYSRAQVTFCPSYSESTHIASAESICCGCSVVVPPTIRHRVLQWYTTHDSGSIAKEDTPEAMADAILQELKLWEEGKRSPKEIATYWQEVFHADKAMKRIFNL